jgi:hypothetical protein
MSKRASAKSARLARDRARARAEDARTGLLRARAATSYLQALRAARGAAKAAERASTAAGKAARLGSGKVVSEAQAAAGEAWEASEQARIRAKWMGQAETWEEIAVGAIGTGAIWNQGGFQPRRFEGEVVFAGVPDTDAILFLAERWQAALGRRGRNVWAGGLRYTVHVELSDHLRRLIESLLRRGRPADKRFAAELAIDQDAVTHWYSLRDSAQTFATLIDSIDRWNAHSTEVSRVTIEIVVGRNPNA